MNNLISFLFENREWLISGIGIVIVGIAINIASWAILNMEESKGQVFLHWIKKNAQWVFSGISVALISIIVGVASNIYVEKINRTNLKKEAMQSKSKSLMISGRASLI